MSPERRSKDVEVGATRRMRRRQVSYFRVQGGTNTSGTCLPRGRCTVDEEVRRPLYPEGCRGSTTRSTGECVREVSFGKRTRTDTDGPYDLRERGRKGGCEGWLGRIKGEEEVWRRLPGGGGSSGGLESHVQSNEKPSRVSWTHK